ncbi:multidrug transporter [Pseudomonas sp. Marseille-QA0892]
MIVGVLLVVIWLVLLFRYPAKALPVSMTAVALLGIVAAWVVWQQNRLDHRLASLDIRLAYDLNACPPAKPLSIAIRNRSDAVLSSLNWQIAAYFPGETSNLAQRDYDRPRYDAPGGIQPDGLWQECVPTPPIRSGYRAETLEYRAESLNGSFD